MPDDFDDFTNSPVEASDSSTNLSDGAKKFIRENSPSGYDPNEAGRVVDETRRYSPKDDDPGCIGSFEWLDEYKPFKSKEATEKEGRPIEIFEKVLYIRISIRGSDINQVHRPAVGEDKARFPFAWQEFNRGEKARERGIPIQMLGLDVPLIRGFAAKNVFTVEDLAAVSDNNLSNLGIGAREMRRKAIEFLDARKESPVAEARVNEQQALINSQSEQLARMQAQLDRLSDQANKPKRGRPPKVKTDDAS